jgi:hypothetical protein
VRATDRSANAKQRHKSLVGNCIVVKQCCEKGVGTAVSTLKVQSVGGYEMNRRGREGEGGAVGGEGGGGGERKLPVGRKNAEVDVTGTKPMQRNVSAFTWCGMVDVGK